MPSAEIDIGGLSTTIVRAGRDGAATIALLHGFSMSPADLTPFAHSLGVASNFAVPCAPLAVSSGGYSWWNVDIEMRARFPVDGARDLAPSKPPGRAIARRNLVNWIHALPADLRSGPLILGGFSQGGMLAADTVLMEEISVAGLILMSSSRIAIDEWLPRMSRAKNLPVFVSHGESDPELAFAAGFQLASDFRDAGAVVTFVAFSGGHEIPLQVWRALRNFLAPICDARTATLDSTADN